MEIHKCETKPKPTEPTKLRLADIKDKEGIYKPFSPCNDRCRLIVLGCKYRNATTLLHFTGDRLEPSTDEWDGTFERTDESLCAELRKGSTAV